MFFHFGAMPNNDAIDILVHICFHCVCLRMKFLGPSLCICSILLDTATQFSKVIIPIYTPHWPGYESSSSFVSPPVLGNSPFRFSYADEPVQEPRRACNAPFSDDWSS